MVLSQPCYHLLVEDVWQNCLYEYKKRQQIIGVDLYVHDNTFSFIWLGVGIAHVSPSS